jgi:hypothetical protein
VGDHVEQHVERSRWHLDHAIRTAELARRSIEWNSPNSKILCFARAVHNEEKISARKKNSLTKKANP